MMKTFSERVISLINSIFNEKEQVRIFVSFVGGADSFKLKKGAFISSEGVEDKEGGLVKIARRVKPHYILMMYTPDFKTIEEDNVKYIRDHSDILGANCHLIPIDLAEGISDFDATKFEHLRKVVPNKVNSVLEQIQIECGDADYQLSINATSGTPQMISTLYSAVNFSKIPALRLNMFPDDARREHVTFYQGLEWKHTKVADGSPEADFHKKEVRNFTLDFLNEDSIFVRLREAAQKFDFHLMEVECRELWKNRPRSSLGRSLAYALEQICVAAQLADQMNFGEDPNEIMTNGELPKSAVAVMNSLCLWNGDAHKVKMSDMHDVSMFVKTAEAYRDRLSDLVKVSQPASNRVVVENSHNLIELYRNIQRCFVRASYTDVLSRYYRLGEGIIYYVLQKKYKENARKPWGVCLKVQPMQQKEFLKIYDRVFFNDKEEYYIKKHKTFDWKTVMAQEFRRGSEGLGFHKAYKLLSLYCIEEAERTGKQTFLEESCVNDGGASGNPGELGQKIKKIREIRNATIVAHSMGAVTEENAKTAMEVLDTLMQRAHLVTAADGKTVLLPEIPEEDQIISVAKLTALIGTLEKYSGESTVAPMMTE